MGWSCCPWLRASDRPRLTPNAPQGANPLPYTLHTMTTTISNREKATRLVNKQVKLLSDGAVCLSDLADTFNLCAGLDELEELIEQADEFTPMQDLQDLAQDIACQLLEEEGFPV